MFNAGEDKPGREGVCTYSRFDVEAWWEEEKLLKRALFTKKSIERIGLYTREKNRF
jgi:hypothetical protein